MADNTLIDSGLANHSRVWSMEGELLRCRYCNRAQVASNAHEKFKHALTCGVRDSASENPWLELARLTASLIKPLARDEKLPLITAQVEDAFKSFNQDGEWSGRDKAHFAHGFHAGVAHEQVREIKPIGVAMLNGGASGCVIQDHGDGMRGVIFDKGVSVRGFAIPGTANEVLARIENKGQPGNLVIPDVDGWLWELSVDGQEYDVGIIRGRTQPTLKSPVKHGVYEYSALVAVNKLGVTDAKSCHSAPAQDQCVHSAQSVHRDDERQTSTSSGSVKTLTASEIAKDRSEYTYASKQATHCAGCNKHKHTPLRVDHMGGYVCLTCIDQRLGDLLDEEVARNGEKDWEGSERVAELSVIRSELEAYASKPTSDAGARLVAAIIKAVSKPPYQLLNPDL
jgi:hypothetical protein